MLGGHYLIAIDGTGIRSSHKVKCEKCCVKNHRNGSTTYFHQMLGATMIHPDHSVVLPLAPEPIRKEDGAKKNDCERNAAKRLLDDLRRDHPRLKAIIVEDALASNAPHINHLKNKGFRNCSPRYAARSYCLIMSAAFPSSAIRMASIGLYPSSAIESR